MEKISPEIKNLLEQGYYIKKIKFLLADITKTVEMIYGDIEYATLSDDSEFFNKKFLSKKLNEDSDELINYIDRFNNIHVPSKLFSDLNLCETREDCPIGDVDILVGNLLAPL